MPTKLYFDGLEMKVRTIKFSGGELQPRITDGPVGAKTVRLFCQAYSNDDILEMLLIKNAAAHWLRSSPIYATATAPRFELEVPYLPYARQDRVCHPGEADSLSVIAALIGTAHFDSVMVWDVHNWNATASKWFPGILVNRCADVFVKRIAWESGRGSPVIVAPDEGAVERAELCAKALNTQVIYAEKDRDPDTGAITGITVITPQPNQFADKDFLIVDDICDGGRTFIELAKMLRPLTTGKIFLYVTHGIFSNGFNELMKHIDRIYCPHIFPTGPNEMCEHTDPGFLVRIEQVQTTPWFTKI